MTPDDLKDVPDGTLVDMTIRGRLTRDNENTFRIVQPDDSYRWYELSDGPSGGHIRSLLRMATAIEVLPESGPPCKGGLTIKGEFFPCDWPTDSDGRHPGWGHSSKVAQATWVEDPNVVQKVQQPEPVIEPMRRLAMVVDSDVEPWVCGRDGLWARVGEEACAWWAELVKDYGPLTVIFEGVDESDDYIDRRAAENRAHCRVCGTSDAECTERILGKSWRSCCVTCQNTDTHPKKEARNDA